MKKAIEFFIRTALGGVFVLLPVALVVFLLASGFNAAREALVPLADTFPEDSILRTPMIIGLLIVVAAILIAFLVGLAMRLAFARSAGGWLERTLLMRLPGYKVMKRLTTGFSESLAGEGYRPAMMTIPGGQRQLVLIVEEEGGEEVTAFLPTSPTAAIGVVQRVKRDKLEVIDAELLEIVDVLSHWGVGLDKLLSEAGRKDSPASE